MFKIQAACGCNIGLIRKNNEDNFYFDGKFLEKNNSGIDEILTYEEKLKNGFCVAVFDGMGGENFGEAASYVACAALKHLQEEFSLAVSDTASLLKVTAKKLDGAVVDMQQQLCTHRMGTTMVGLLHTDSKMYVCNVGDSRAYILRDGGLTQLSVDHVEKRNITGRHKSPLTQYLGFGYDDIEIDPFVSEIKIENDDIYLLCSDGLSDMLSDAEIQEILNQKKNMTECIDTMIRAALEYGGRDNITVILCKVTEGEDNNE